MGLINCPECGKEVSDQAGTCPGCGKKIKKPKPAWLIVIAIICGIIGVLVLISAGKDLLSAIELSKNDPQTISDEKKIHDFKVSTDEELSTLPDQQGLIDAAGNGSELIKILANIGVTGIDKQVDIGNVRNNNGVYNVSIRCNTSEEKTLLIDFIYIDIEMYSNSKWQVISISDYNSGDLYYIPEEQVPAYDIYDYKTGEIKSKATISPKELMNKNKEILDKE